jgi:hypothetical protein
MQDSHILWFRTTIDDEGPDALRFVAHRLREVEDGNAHAWKWVVIGLHNALHIFILMAAGTAPLLWAITPKEQDAVMKAIRGEGKYPKDWDRISSLRSLYPRAKQTLRFEPGDQTDDDIALLIELRDGFVHRAPSRWSIWVPDLLRCARSTLSVIQHIGWGSDEVRWFEESLERTASSALDSCWQRLTEIEGA